ncbi:hypothetical protein FRC14_004077 [Serendipita sp. 396]|nr:hypothetical protein FRC14_004077 [Serendipita sp. 396]KAG8788190.1 hypothetical protein FRC15_005629 [Serendipita sp. 397]KAG8803246.1 hypothetical protein FRC16_006479 [Serendipita sp. 398]KAG8836857.1 hypothetical protein FRC18_010572 [Serendipita sp. 400]KAG8861056.1 hypothetical protein FRB91_011092 [Serendipita sp. 411]KAG8874234.1 hypothetical protein FRC20_006440 [Serendipita sp. 405]
MAFKPFHLSVAIITYVVLGGFTVLFGMFSLLIREKLYLGEAILAFLFGVIVGPYGANIFNPRDWGGGNDDEVHAIVLEVTRVVLAVGVFAIGVELPSKYAKKHYKSLLFLLGPVMAIGWVVCAGLIYALIPALDFLSSLAIAACLTPTDPILAAAVINGRYAEKHVPEHLRHLLSCESGSNDGAAFPFLFLALYLILEADDRVAVGHWFYITWVYEIILGIILGTLIGWGFRHLMKFCESRDLIDRHSYVAQYISLALLSNGITALLGSDDLLAAFCSGVAFAWDSHFNKQTADSVFSAVIDLLFNVAIFVFIGAWTPFNKFNDVETTITVWRLVVLAILVLLLRRLPVMLLLYRWIPDVRTFREAVFSGHFGPMGVGAIFIATLALEKLPHPHHPPSNQTDVLSLSIEPIIAFMVMTSILIHGLSIPFFNLGRRVTSLTFSRTMSLRGAHEPEWAGQTVKVTRPEDIVINRDVLPPPTLTEKEMEEGRAAMTNSSGSDATGKNVEAETLAPSEEDDVEVREWREGRHLVREYHPKEPGQEVRVEVIRDAFADSGRPNMDAVKATFTVASDTIRDEVMRYLGAFSQRGSLEKSRSHSHSRPASIQEILAPESQIQRVDSLKESEIVLEPDDSEDWVDEPTSEPESVDSGGKPRKKTATSRTKRPGGRSTSMRRAAMDGARSSQQTSGNVTPQQTSGNVTPTVSVALDRQPSLIQSTHGSTAIEFQRTDSISSVKSGDRVARLRVREGTGTSTPGVRSRDSSPSRNVRFAAEPSKPQSQPPSTPVEPSDHPQRASVLKPLRR